MEGTYEKNASSGRWRGARNGAGLSGGDIRSGAHVVFIQLCVRRRLLSVLRVCLLFIRILLPVRLRAACVLLSAARVSVLLRAASVLLQWRALLLPLSLAARVLR